MQALARSTAGLRLMLRLNGDLLLVILAILIGLSAGVGLATLMIDQP